MVLVPVRKVKVAEILPEMGWKENPETFCPFRVSLTSCFRLTYLAISRRLMRLFSTTLLLAGDWIVTSGGWEL